MTDKQRFIDHVNYGIGYAILTRHRRKPSDDLWMVRFDNSEDTLWYCTKHFLTQDEVMFISDTKAKELRKKPRRKRKRSTRKAEEESLLDFLKNF